MQIPQRNLQDQPVNRSWWLGSKPDPDDIQPFFLLIFAPEMGVGGLSFDIFVLFWCSIFVYSIYRMQALTMLQSISAQRCGIARQAGNRGVVQTRGMGVVARGYKVEVENDGKVTVLDVPEDESILSVALEEGLELPHDCKLGVCMNCAARLVSLMDDIIGIVIYDLFHNESGNGL